MPLDIVIFGVIAVFLIFRFLGVLGQNDKDDGRPRRDAFGNYRKQMEEKRAQRATARASNASKKDGFVEKQKQKVEQLRAKKSRYELQDSTRADVSATSPASIGDKAFLEGAKGAFAMILEAYSGGDEARLSSLLAKGELLSSMVGEIAKRKKIGHRLAISLHEVMDTKIVERASDSDYEHITVEFVSKQCHLEFDKDNKLVEGDPDVEEVLTDLWTFRQALNSSDPTWFLCATRSKDTNKTTKSARLAKASADKTSGGAKKKVPKARK